MEVLDSFNFGMRGRKRKLPANFVPDPWISEDEPDPRDNGVQGHGRVEGPQPPGGLADINNPDLQGNGHDRGDPETESEPSNGPLDSQNTEHHEQDVKMVHDVEHEQDAEQDHHIEDEDDVNLYEPGIFFLFFFFL